MTTWTNEMLVNLSLVNPNTAIECLAERVRAAEERRDWKAANLAKLALRHAEKNAK